MRPRRIRPDAPSPLLDLSDAAVKKMIKQAKKRGFVTFDQLNEVLPSDTTSPEQIEDIMSMLSDMGINVSEAEDADSEDETKEEAEDETDNELVEVTQKAVTEVKKSEPGERTDDPVRMYLREMGTVELLSREGEIAIAKRIEAGREAMIAGLVRKPADLPGHHHLARRTQRGKDLPSRHHRSRSHLCRPRRQEQHEPGAAGARRSAPTASRWWPADGNGNGAAAVRRGRACACRAAGRAAVADPVPSRAAPADAADGEKDPARSRRRMATWTTTSSKTRCRSRPSRPS